MVALKWVRGADGVLRSASSKERKAAYARRYRAAASQAWRMREAIRQTAWRKAHRRLAQEYPERFKELLREETEREKLRRARE